jgi:ligand-binding sensor domain-containing protein
MKKILLLLLLFSACTYNYAQTPDIKFDHIGIKEGLPEAQVSNILQDAEGYIWMGTQNGLVRYDGYNYKVYQLGSDKQKRQLNTSASSIFESLNKVIWVSTLYNGLFLYDRKSDTFQQFVYPKQLRYIKIDAEDNSKNIWGRYFEGKILGQDGLGIVKFNTVTGTFELFNSNAKGVDHINGIKFNQVYKTKDGTIWIATNNGLYRYAGEGKGFKGYFTTNDTTKALCFNPIYEAPSEPGVLWANTFHGDNINLKLARFDYRHNTLKNYLPGKKPGELMNADIYSIYEDKKNQLWLGLDSGIAKLDRKTGLFTNYLKKDTAKNSLSDIVETPKGNFWLSSALGLVYFNTASGEFKLYSGADAPGYINVKTIDNTGQLWIGAFGVYKTNYLKSAFHILKNIPGKATGYPGGGSTIAPADSGNYWAFVASSIYKWKPATGEFKKIINTNINNHDCHSICQGDKGVVYLATTNGLRAYNTLTKKEEVLTNTPVDTGFIKKAALLMVYRDHNGTIWFGSYQQGISSFDPKTKKLTRYPYKFGNSLGDDHNDGKLDDNIVLSIYEDKENTLWVGTNNGGLNKFHRATGKFYSYHSKKNQNLFCVTDIHEDASGRMWAGTYLNGLFEFDKKTGNIIKNINEGSGLLHNEVLAINEDTTGHLLLLTERGITRYDPATGKIQNFSVGTILPGEDILANVFEGAPRFASNSVAFSLNDGVVEFNPQALAPNTTVPIVHITGITYSDPLSGPSATTIIPYGINTLELAHNQNRIQFDYIGLHYDDPSQNKYAYKLDGYDNDWVQAGTVRTVTYTNLSPGTYTFHVRASNADGIWNNTGAGITIIIHTSQWMRWWAWLIYIVLFAAAIYGFIAYRSRALKRENQILEEKINLRTQQLSHANKELSEQQEEITTQRDRLAETVNELKTTQSQLIQSEKLASLGELTAGIAHEIQNPLNFVNNFSEVSMELAVELKAELAEGNAQEANALADDIEKNLEKIIHHGKRADGIVKNMLQHSRNNSGEKEPTDINYLAD